MENNIMMCRKLFSQAHSICNDSVWFCAVGVIRPSIIFYCCQIQINPLFDTDSICYGSLSLICKERKAIKIRNKQLKIFEQNIIFFFFFFASQVDVFVHSTYVFAYCICFFTHKSMNEYMNEIEKRNEDECFFCSLLFSYFYIVCPAFHHCCHFVVVYCLKISLL